MTPSSAIRFPAASVPAAPSAVMGFGRKHRPSPPGTGGSDTAESAISSRSSSGAHHHHA